MSEMFNSDQQSYMDSLSKLPAAARCWCGWYMAGDCHDCNERFPGKTLADHKREMNLDRLRAAREGGK